MKKIRVEEIEYSEFLAQFKTIIQEVVREELTSQESENEDVELLTIEQIADLLNVSESTIHNWKREGRIPYKRMGRRVYFYKEEVL